MWNALALCGSLWRVWRGSRRSVSASYLRDIERARYAQGWTEGPVWDWDVAINNRPWLTATERRQQMHVVKTTTGLSERTR
jgi:hypothetical protein